MDLRSLTATILAQAKAEVPLDQARRLETEPKAALPPPPFAGALPAGSFHAGMADAFGAAHARSAVSSV